MTEFRLVPEPSSLFARVSLAPWQIDWLFDADQHAGCATLGCPCVRSQMLIVPVTEDEP